MPIRTLCTARSVHASAAMHTSKPCMVPALFDIIANVQLSSKSICTEEEGRECLRADLLHIVRHISVPQIYTRGCHTDSVA